MAQQVSDEPGIALISSPKTTREARYSMISACFNFVNSIIGSGVVGLPYALNQAGLPFGVLLLIIVAFITDYTIILLIKGGNLSGTNSYQSLVQSTFGFPGFLILSALQFLYPFIAMISYNITTGDTLTKIFQRISGVGPDHIMADRHFVIVMSTVLCTLPLSLYRNIERLGKSPDGGGVAFCQVERNSGSRRHVVCLHMSPQQLSDLRLSGAAHANQLDSGHTHFGWLSANHQRRVCGGKLRHLYGLHASIITTFPLECFVTREVISNSICGRELSKVEHISVTVIIVAACTAMSLAYDCLGIVLELNGALSATPLIFIIPSACFLKLSPGRWYHSENLMPAILIALGVFVMITGLTMTGLNPQDCSHGAEMFYCADANVSATLAPV
ncbi:putative sodium-coupled neutral amino acid transporter 11 isoform X3 [Hippocampus comes]|uniref:putative sodium-coupled neutral amino acid transporter 11 isoform X3 n=1 Tax=Hippocampus comes TaxID=109280 RepID=UPI00094E7ED5|nr:PREDICTED: putative sodium-coupled neutral amino acid transporter 11 isoform X3 [Hippocampus comes]